MEYIKLFIIKLKITGLKFVLIIAFVIIWCFKHNNMFPKPIRSHL